MTTTFTVTHVTLQLESSFENFTANFETVIGRFKDPDQHEIDTDPEATIEKIKGWAGMENLYWIPTGDPRKMLNLYGGHAKLKQYGWGNPLMAGAQILRHIGVALYAPFRLIVYETDDKKLFAEYDLPSTYLRQFGEETEAVGLSLDKKIQILIAHAQKTTV